MHSVAANNVASSNNLAPVGHQHIHLAFSDGDRKRAQSAMHEHIQFVPNSLLKSLETEREIMDTADIAS